MKRHRETRLMFHVEHLRVPTGRKLVTDDEAREYVKRVAEARARLDAFWLERGHDEARKMT